MLITDTIEVQGLLSATLQLVGRSYKHFAHIRHHAVWVPAFAGTTMAFSERHLRSQLLGAGSKLHPPYGGSRRGSFDDTARVMTRPARSRRLGGQGLGGQGLGGQGLGGQGLGGQGLGGTAQSR